MALQIRTNSGLNLRMTLAVIPESAFGDNWRTGKSGGIIRRLARFGSAESNITI